MADDTSLVPLERVQNLIRLVRGQKVMLDSDLAAVYEVETRALVQAVRRNESRFPPDFMFQLSAEEYSALRSQIVISKGRGGRRYMPYAFTEQGVAMLSSVLDSPRAIQANIAIMRAFVRLRQVLASHEELAQMVAELQARFDEFETQIPELLLEAIRLMFPPADAVAYQRIGFRSGADADELPATGGAPDGARRSAGTGQPPNNPTT